MTELDVLFKRGAEFLKCKYPIMGGAMSYISESNLVAALSNAGGFGVLATSAMNKEELIALIKETKDKTKNTFAVNLILLNPKVNELVEACIEEKIEYVVLAGGIPSKEIIDKLKTNNCKVLTFAPNLPIAKKMVGYGVDALILEGSEAGGHIGPVSTSILVQEVLPYIKEVPIFVAGGVGTGEVMTNYLRLGAAGVQIGTILVCSNESIAHENFKQAFIKAKSRQAESTVQVSPEFPVIPVRAIKNKGSIEFIEHQHSVINDFKNGSLTKQEATMKIELFWAGALKRAVLDGDVERGSLMAGQIVGLVDAINSVDTILQNIIKQAKNHLG